MTSKRILLPVLLAMALALVACGGRQAANKPAAETVVSPIPEMPAAMPTETESYPAAEAPISPATEAPATPPATVTAYQQVRLSPAQAFDIFMTKFPGTSVHELQLDQDHGVYVYEVEGFDDANEYEMAINPADGSIILEKTKVRTKDRTALERSLAEGIPAIIDKALAAAGVGAALEEWTLDTKSGRPVIEVEIELSDGRDVEWVYDAATGEQIE